MSFVAVRRRELAANRRAGRDFDAAWNSAFLRASTGDERNALVATEHGWRSAFNDVEPTRAERALAVTGSSIDELPDDLALEGAEP